MQTPEIFQEIKELLSLKQKHIDMEKLTKVDLNEHSAFLSYLVNVKNILTLNKIGKEYKKITGKGPSIIPRIILSLAISSGFSVALFFAGKEVGKDIMEYVFLIFNFILLLSISSYCLIRDYFQDLKALLITSWRQEHYFESPEDKVVVLMMQKIKTEYQKEEILKNIPENKNTEVVSIKRKRI